MPRYQLGKRELLEDLLAPVWKKPSANLLLLEMSFSPPVIAWPTIRELLFAAVHAEKQHCNVKISPNIMYEGENMVT
jgi:hypothetical protein